MKTHRYSLLFYYYYYLFVDEHSKKCVCLASKMKASKENQRSVVYFYGG